MCHGRGLSTDSVSLLLPHHGNDAAHTHRAGGVLKVGNRTECALLQLTESLGVSYAEVREAAAPRVLRQFPFSSDRKRMSTLLEGRSNGEGEAPPARLHLKGAAELVLDLCTTRGKLDGSVQVRPRCLAHHTKP